LQQEEAAGQIPANESCYCQVGATTPTCVQNAASTCQAILPAEESRLGPNAKYYDCTCPSGASTPSCPSYYSLCQDNLQYYQNSLESVFLLESFDDGGTLMRQRLFALRE
jgi:hypothetical protein